AEIAEAEEMDRTAVGCRDAPVVGRVGSRQRAVGAAAGGVVAGGGRDVAERPADIRRLAALEIDRHDGDAQAAVVESVRATITAIDIARERGAGAAEAEGVVAGGAGEVAEVAEGEAVDCTAVGGRDAPGIRRVGGDERAVAA